MRRIADRQLFSRMLPVGLQASIELVRLSKIGGIRDICPIGTCEQFYGQTVMRAFFRLVAATILVFGVTGCTSVSYYAQSLKGHVKIMTARQDVAKLIDDPSTPEALRARMASASAIRQFAVDELALPDNNSYRSYVDVGREAVTWAVFAAPEFSLTPRAWCFPVYGCVPYRGYFSKKSATEIRSRTSKAGAGRPCDGHHCIFDAGMVE